MIHSFIAVVVLFAYSRAFPSPCSSSRSFSNFDLLKTLKNFSTILQTLQNGQNDLQNCLLNGQVGLARKIHLLRDFDALSLETLSKASSRVECNINGVKHWSTKHGIMIDDTLMELTVKHCPCSSQFDHVSCPNMDVVLFPKCPKVALHVPQPFVALRFGEKSNAFGFVPESGPRISTGTLSGRFDLDRNYSNIPFRSGEYLIQGATELPGMSGGPASNGYGYTGIVHGLNYFDDHLKLKLSMTMVIPIDLIFRECISQLDSSTRDIFSSFNKSSCKDTEIVSLPIWGNP